jgi:hypothetical protein
MKDITERDWSFKDIRAQDAARADRLEFSGSPQRLVEALVDALAAVGDDGLRFGIDSEENKFNDWRPIVQFRVAPDLYDWFFNGRTGYRAQFWIAPECGIDFNRRLTAALTSVLARRLPASILARKIEVTTYGASRHEYDVGQMTLTSREFLDSLAPDMSKVWLGERLITGVEGRLTDIGFATLSSAAQSSAKLCVPRWATARNPKTGELGEGLRAPLPCSAKSWLDLKGGFLTADSTPLQIKSPAERAREINELGWT